MSNISTQRHILAINNAQEVLELFRILLEAEGFRVSTQSYVSRDLAEVKRLAPDLIIIDYMWAGEDGGWSMLQMLKMDPNTAHLPIIICTGAVREVEALTGHLTEMDIKVILKPFDIEHLLRAVRGAFSQADGANVDGHDQFLGKTVGKYDGS